MLRLDQISTNALDESRLGLAFVGWIFPEWLSLNGWTHTKFADISKQVVFDQEGDRSVGLIHSNNMTKLSSRYLQSKHFSIRAIRAIVATNRYVWLINHGGAEPPTENPRDWTGKNAFVIDKRKHVRENGHFYAMDGDSKVEVLERNPEYRLQTVFSADSNCITIGTFTEAVCGVRRDIVIEAPPILKALVNKEAELIQIGKAIRSAFAAATLDLVEGWESISGFKDEDLQLLKKVALGVSIEESVDIETLSAVAKKLMQKI